MNVRRGLVMVAFGALLAACGPVHAGSAAVVGSDRISMTEADEVSQGYCTLSMATAAMQGRNSIPGGDVRRQALSLLILESVAEQVAEQEGFSVHTPKLSGDEAQQARQLFGDRTELVAEAIARNEKALSVATRLAQRELGAEADSMSEQELAQAGQQLLFERAESFDIEIDPRFGMTGLGEIAAPTGSLSVPGPAVQGQELPEVLSCTA